MKPIPERTPAPVLLFMPQGRDAEIAEKLLGDLGMESAVVSGLDAFAARLDNDLGFAILTEESLRSADLRAIAAWIDAQPSWSDLPFVLLTLRGASPERNPAAMRLTQILGNVTFLERPFNAMTFASVARTALKGRRRQFEARARIDDLRESEERLQTALLAGRLGTWELDLDTRLLVVSEQCKAIFGRRADETWTYADAMDSIHPDDRIKVAQMLEFSLANASDYVVEHRTRWPDDTLHWTEVRARFVGMRNGSARRLVGVASDITERKAYEDHLRTLAETLEERVALRTAELSHAHQTLLLEVEQRERAEEKLRHSQKMEAIGQLTGGIAHDFNNLLMAVMGNLDLLNKHSAGDARAGRLIDGALQGARRGAALTQRLLAFARKQDLKIEPVDMTSLIAGMTDLLERSIGPQIILQIRTLPALPPALIDGNQVELALLNLAVNARDAMPGGGTLVIKLDVAEPPDGSELVHGTYLRLSVTDTGHGMNDETLRKAIDPFFSTKELGKGTGLGLSMIHGLAVQLKGTLKLFSVPGKGTRAELWLPATSLPVTLQSERCVGIDPAQSESPPIRKATILFVDDDALIAMSTVDMLEDLGHDVIEANSGATALDILKSHAEIDLLITDYSMPSMTGAQLAKAAIDIKPGLPILVATGYADLPAGEGMKLPRLGKPYTQEQLAREIGKLLKA